jgi:hypothetical protein
MPQGNSGTSQTLYSPESRGHLHAGAQRKAIRWTIIITAILAILIVPLVVNTELRLDAARFFNIVPHHDGEMIASENDEVSLVTLPIATQLGANDLVVYRTLAAYIAEPVEDGLRFEALNGDGEFVLPFDEFDLISNSPDASQMYVSGQGGAALVDVESSDVIQSLESGAAPGVEWDWQTPSWTYGVNRCDSYSVELEWIACFQRSAATSFAGNWHLQLVQFGNPDNAYDVVVGLGIRPSVGFTEDDGWVYIANERGIVRYDVGDITAD